MRKTLLLALGLLGALSAHAADFTRTFTVTAGEVDRTNAVVRVPLSLPAALKDATVRLTDAAGTVYAAQLLTPGLLAAPVALTDAQVARELLLVVPKLAKGTDLTLTATIAAADDGKRANDGFRWQDKPGECTDLLFGDRQVLRYQKLAYTKDKAKRGDTYKVFHHVFDPATGKVQLTKGPGGQFTHHRGIYFGFNKVTYEDAQGKKQNVDIWHCPVAWQGDAGTLLTEGGALAARERLAIDWHGVGDEVFAKETRELTILNLAGGTLIEWATRLTATVPKIHLDGDPQHAGFHYRASGEVSDKNAKQTYYLRPDGKDKLGATRNWPGNKQHANLPWDVMSFVVGDQRYSVQYLDRPTNPKEARFSERDYGRFGSYFVHDLTPDKPLELCYRLWIQGGELTGEQAAALSTDFLSPVAVK